MQRFTNKEDKFLHDNYLTMPAKTMSKCLNRSESSARQRMALLNIVVPAEIINKFIENSRFKKGQVAINKGKKMVDYMSVASMEKCKSTMFKKGNLPHNTKTDLEITLRTDKLGKTYHFIRIKKALWVPLLRYNWVKENGPIPAKMKLIHKDGNILNSDASNAELLTCADLMKRNTLHNYPKEIVRIIKLNGALNKQINKHIKILNEK